MRFEPVIGDRYFVTFEQLGTPTVRSDVEVPGLGIVVLDDADIHFAAKRPEAGFFVRQSKALGGRFVVVSRQHSA